MSNVSKAPKTKPTKAPTKVTLEERWGAVPSGMGRLLPHDLFAVYVEMQTYSNNKTRQCYPSKESLAYATGTTEKTIEKAWAQLESVGAIVRIREGFVKDGINRAAVFECRGPKDVLKKLSIAEEVLESIKPQDVSWFVRQVNPDTDRVSKRPPSGQAMPKKRRKESYYVEELKAVAEAQAASEAEATVTEATVTKATVTKATEAEAKAPETEVPHLNDYESEDRVPHLNDQVPHLNDQVPHLNDSMPHLNDQVPHLNGTPNTLVTPKKQLIDSSLTSHDQIDLLVPSSSSSNLSNDSPDLRQDIEIAGRVEEEVEHKDSEVVQLLKGFPVPRLTPAEAATLWLDGWSLVSIVPLSTGPSGIDILKLAPNAEPWAVEILRGLSVEAWSFCEADEDGVLTYRSDAPEDIFIEITQSGLYNKVKETV